MINYNELRIQSTEVLTREKWNGLVTKVEERDQEIVNALTITADKKIGIGTSTPAVTLDIEGSVRLGNRPGGGNNLYFTDHTKDHHYIGVRNWWTDFVSHPNEGWRFKAKGDAAPVLAVQAGTGRMGLGTASPQERFQIGDRWTFHDGGWKLMGYNWTYKNNQHQRIVDGHAGYLAFKMGQRLDFFLGEHGAAGSHINYINFMSFTHRGLGVSNEHPIAQLHLGGEYNSMQFGSSGNPSNNFHWVNEVRNSHRSLNLYSGDLYKGKFLFSINNKANVSIGENNYNRAKLEINGFQENKVDFDQYSKMDKSDFHKPQYILRDGDWRSGGINWAVPGKNVEVPTPYSVKASHNIAANEFHAYSDGRIKNILGQSNSQHDLGILQKIQITDYVYRDPIDKGNRLQKKVIGQQVAKVYPLAVNTDTREIIPDIMVQTMINDGWISLQDHDLKIGETVRLIFENVVRELPVIEICSNAFQVESDQKGVVFVYGRQVNDFHTVDYEALAMLNISATQALYQRLEEANKRINYQEEVIRSIMEKPKHVH